MEENKTYVLDASVVLKWFLEETEDKEQADLLLEAFMAKEIDVLVPAHFYSELLNILSMKLPGFALEVLSQLRLGGIYEHSLSLDVASIALELRKKHKKISFYDAFYHAIALQKGLRFITADKGYFKTVKKEGNILLLSDYA